MELRMNLVPRSRRPPWRIWLAALALAQALPAIAQTATPDPAALAQQLERSLRLIDALTARVEQLEKQLAGTARDKPTATAAAAPASGAAVAVASKADNTTITRIDQLEKTIDQLTAAAGRESRDGGLPLHGFADVGWSQVRHPAAGQRSGFAVGSLDFYLTPEIGKVRTLVEMNVGVEQDGETVIDLERAQIGYSFSDALTLWLGRFHTPFGYWNMAFHHGAQIQTSILRPRFLNFEDDGGVLPVHTTGVWGTGGMRTGAGKLVYHLYAGNGTTIKDGALDPNAGGDDNGNRVVGFGINHRFSGTLDGVALGLHGLTQTVHAYDATGALQSRTRLRMLGAHAVYDDDGWELIGEAYRLRDSDLSGSGGSHDNTLGYVHLGHAFADRWVPYARWERASLDATDDYFASLATGRSYTRRMLGMRYNADPRAALKLEWNRTHDDGIGHAVDELRMQYAVGF
jgi:hypothetical protein